MDLCEGEVKCEDCHGTGKDRTAMQTSICNKCGGKGKLDWVANVMASMPAFETNHCALATIEPSSDITFYHEGVESIKIGKDGFYVKGKKIADDNKIYDAFVDFFRGVGTYI